MWKLWSEYDRRVAERLSANTTCQTKDHYWPVGSLGKHWVQSVIDIEICMQYVCYCNMWVDIAVIALISVIYHLLADNGFDY